ncbi:hypothetical protein HRbin36_02020 [bacterium HR36]|nr:hypothetical protein HRbin36_02020 [bacterium HR36]
MLCSAQRNFGRRAIGATLGLWFALGSMLLAQPEPKHKEPIRVKAKPSEPGSYYGPHSGKCLITIRGADGKVQEVVDINLKDQLQVFWNLSRPKAQEDISKHKLLSSPDYYNKKVTVAAADKRASLHLGVTPSANQVALSYLVMGHEVSFKKKNRILGADPLAPDSAVTIRFDLELIAVFKTSGPPSGPLVLDNAEVKVRGVRVSVDGNWVHDVGEYVIERFRKTDFEAMIERSFTGAAVDVKDLLGSGLQVINSKLTGYTHRKGYFLQSPKYDKSTGALVLELVEPRKIDPNLTKPRIPPKTIDKSKLPIDR